MIKEKYIITILTLACIVVAAWIGLSIYHNAKTSTIDDATQVQIDPITPQFDMQVMTDLQNRQKVSPLFSAQAAPTPVVSPKATQPPLVKKTPSVPITTPTTTGVVPTASAP